MGDAISKHADAGGSNRLSRNVSARGDKHFGRPWHDTTVRNFWRTVYRCADALSRAKPSEAAGRFFPRELFSADFSQVRRRSLRRRSTAHTRSRKIPSVSDGSGNHHVHSQNLPCAISVEAATL